MESNQDELVTCEACGEQYDYIDEPPEVQQQGNHICAPCWEKEE